MTSLGSSAPVNLSFLELIAISCYRCSSDDPVWDEVAKRYQQIIDKDIKLLSQFPVYYDGQVFPLATPVKVTVNTLPSLKEGGKQKGASTFKLSEKCTEIGSISANEYGYSSMLTEKTEDDHLPKIMEVYSLNSRKSNAQEPGLKSNTQGGLSCKNEEPLITKSDMSAKQASNSLPQDTNTCIHSPKMMPYLGSGNFIDLTVEDEEETKLCNDEGIARSGDEDLCGRDVKAGDRSEFDRPRKDTGDKGRQSKKSNQRKRKGVFGNGRKGKSRCPGQNQKQNTNKSLKIGDQDETQCKALNDKLYSYHGNGEQELNDLNNNNNDCRKEEKNNSAENKDERKEHWNGSRINGGVHISPDMTYRENKITTLKARLAKQEEELARLRTQNKSKIAEVRSLETPDQDAGQDKIESEANDLSNKSREKQEAEKDDPVEVNLDDICQHVIKSFDIYNARQWESKMRKKERFHTLYEENTCIIKQANGRKSDFNGVAYLPQGRQDEFLFQIGLSRKRPSNT